MSKVQSYCAVSLDGFIAGVDDDLSWLDQPEPTVPQDPGTVSFSSFLEQVGAMLMGRRTFDVVRGLGVDWPYGSIPVLVATSRPLENAPPSVSACSGGIRHLCERAEQAADGKSVYLDGGNVISQALEAGIVDELILTVVPLFLGSGVRLFQGTTRQRMSLDYMGRLGSMIQIKLAATGKGEN